MEKSFRLGFQASNNEAEYKALLARLRMAKQARASRVRVLCDSRLVVNQVNGEFEAKEHKMIDYLKEVKLLQS